LVIPEGHDFEQPCPLYVWLHGRGDKNTDLHFLYERATRAGQITPAGAIVLHPFGRHCVGWKHAGEIDVMEAIGDVQANYNIDPERIVLIGFSMGGAGAWHIGAHYSSFWIAVAPGAGFAETARYQRLTPDRYPPWYEQKLWGLYDVPGYVRNLFNTEVIAYSGELDKQIQAARVMEEAFQSEGRELTHLIGPGVEHKYEPETLQELLRRLEAIVAKGRALFPKEAHLQTRTVRYGHQSWIVAEQLEEHWAESRIDAVRTPDRYEVTTKNVVRFKLILPGEFQAKTEFVVDGEVMPAAAPGQGLRLPDKVGSFTITNRGVETRPPQFVPGQAAFIRRNGKWRWLTPDAEETAARHLLKRPQLQGPIDDIYMRQFLVITPTGKSKNPRFQAWVDFEIAHFRDRWRALMRGEPPMKTDVEFTDADATRPLVLWGDPDSNSVMRRMLDKTWIDFQDGQWTFGGQSFDGDRFVPALIYPRRVTRTTPAFGNSPARQATSDVYTVLNSGLTFREGHDRTNSLQNPKLPDWAVIDLSQPPDAFTPGRIHDAGFFDEYWQFKTRPQP
jgi:predicted esterase